MKWLKKKYEQVKGEVKEEFRHRSKVKKAEKESYREAQLKEAGRYGKMKAAHETKEKITALRKPRESPGYTFGGFAGPTTKQSSPSVGIAEYLTSGAPRARNAPTMDILGSKPKSKNVSKELKRYGL